MLRLSALGFALAVVIAILVGMGDVQTAKASSHELPADVRALVNTILR